MGTGNDGTCKAKLTYARDNVKFRANCHLEDGHEGSHCGNLKDKDGVDQMAAMWSGMNERWVVNSLTKEE
jgi:hypothetical protein